MWQFGAGAILIRRLEPQGEKTRGFSRHAFVRVPVLEWHLKNCPSRLASFTAPNARAGMNRLARSGSARAMRRGQLGLNAGFRP